jgi:hypothetical protein
MQMPPTQAKGSTASSQEDDSSSNASNSNQKIPVEKTINGSNTNGSNANGSSSKMPRSMPSVNVNNNNNNNSNKSNGLTNTNHMPVSRPDPVVPAEYVAETKLPTDIGQFQLRAYRVAGLPVGTEPCVIYARDKPPFGVGTDAKTGLDNLNQHVPVRIHDQCLTSEVFRSQRYVTYYCVCHTLCSFLLGRLD